MRERRTHPNPQDEAAEAALRELFAALPEYRPGPDFAARVLAAAGIREAPPAVVPAVVPWPWPLRAAVAFCLVSAAFAAAWLLPVAAVLATRLLPGGIVEIGAAALLAVAEQLPVVFALGEVATTLYDALRLVASAPPVVGAWLLALALSTLTLRFLAQLLTPSRSPEHVRIS